MLEACYVSIPKIRLVADCERYYKALLRELELFEPNSLGKHTLRALFLGGGGARFLPQQGYLDIAGILNKKFHRIEAQVTVEIVITDPTCLRQEGLEFPLEQVPSVNRFVCDPQCLWRAPMHERKRMVAELGKLLERWAQAGKIVALDIEIGRWPETAWKELLEIIGIWPVHNVSIYFADEPSELEDDQMSDLFLWAVDELARKGFVWQGTYDFARDIPSVWTAIYAERKAYRGFGAGAWSYDGQFFYGNVEDVQEYESRIDKGLSPCIAQYPERVSDKIMRGLSRTGGISLNEIVQILEKQQCLVEKHHVAEEILHKVQKLVRMGYLLKVGERISFTPAGFLLENGIVIQLVNGI